MKTKLKVRLFQLGEKYEYMTIDNILLIAKFTQNITI